MESCQCQPLCISGDGLCRQDLVHPGGEHPPAHPAVVLLPSTLRTLSMLDAHLDTFPNVLMLSNSFVTLIAFACATTVSPCNATPAFAPASVPPLSPCSPAATPSGLPPWTTLNASTQRVQLHRRPHRAAALTAPHQRITQRLTCIRPLPVLVSTSRTANRAPLGGSYWPQDTRGSQHSLRMHAALCHL